MKNIGKTYILLLIAFLSIVITGSSFKYGKHLLCFHSTAILDMDDSNFAYKIDGTDRVEWSSKKKLDWSDFEALPDKRYKHIAALTSSAIWYSQYCDNGYIKYEVKAEFRKNESWVRDEARNEYYLDHEQLHFDITELFARKLRAALADFNFECEQADEFERIASRVSDEWALLQKKYDLETHFSQDMRMQSDWYTYVHVLLNQYKDYALAPTSQISDANE